MAACPASLPVSVVVVTAQTWGFVPAYFSADWRVGSVWALLYWIPSWLVFYQGNPLEDVWVAVPFVMVLNAFLGLWMIAIQNSRLPLPKFFDNDEIRHLKRIAPVNVGDDSAHAQYHGSSRVYPGATFMWSGGLMVYVGVLAIYGLFTACLASGIPSSSLESLEFGLGIALLVIGIITVLVAVIKMLARDHLRRNYRARLNLKYGVVVVARIALTVLYGQLQTVPSLNPHWYAVIYLISLFVVYYPVSFAWMGWVSPQRGCQCYHRFYGDSDIEPMHPTQARWFIGIYFFVDALSTTILTIVEFSVTIDRRVYYLTIVMTGLCVAFLIISMLISCVTMPYRKMRHKHNGHNLDEISDATDDVSLTTGVVTYADRFIPVLRKRKR